MARLQFRSATKSKGFDPIQLSKASLSEMEKRDAAVLKGLQENHAAEMKQRETNLQAMRENDEYTQRRFRENREIEVANLQREQTSLNQITARDQQQAKYDQQATETIISSIVDFSESAMKLDLKRKAAELEKEAKRQEAKPVTNADIGTSEQYSNILNANNTVEQAALQAGTGIDKEAVESNEPVYKTNENRLGEKALNIVENRKSNGRIFGANYTARRSQLRKEPEFLGADRDPAVERALHNKTISDVKTFMRHTKGIANNDYFNDVIIKLNDENDIRIANATRNKEQDVKDYSVERYTDLAKNGTTAQITIAKNNMTKTVGYQKTQEWMSGLVTGANSLEEIEAIGNVPTDNKELYRKRSAKRFNADKATWIANQDKKVAEAQRQRQVDYNQSTITNQDNLVEAAKQNLPQFIKLANQQAREEGNGKLHPIIVRIIADQSKANEDELVELEKKAKNGTLSKADVNASSYTNRKAASELYTGQQSSVYGDSEKAITDGLIATARDITDITGDGPNSPQTLLVHAQLKRDFLKTKQNAGFENPLAAWEEVKRKVATDKENLKGKYYKKIENGRISLPNIELPDVSKEDVEMHDLALKKMLSDGTGTVDLPFILDTPQGMDETFKSSTIPGQIPEFSAGIREFALKYGFSFVEVFNRQRMANNAATGENKPLIKNSVFEQIKAPDISNLIFNKHNNKTQSIRGAVMQDNTASSRLRSKEVPAAQGGLKGLTNNDYSELAFVAGSEAGPGDDVYAVVASILNRAAKTGKPISELIREPGQYQPVYQGKATYDPVLAQDLSSPEGQRKIRSMLVDLEGRTDFKGTTQRQNMGQGDKLYNDMGNFYHYAGQRAGGGIYTGPIDRSYEKYYSN
jgi:hypothetical protein